MLLHRQTDSDETDTVTGAVSVALTETLEKIRNI